MMEKFNFDRIKGGLIVSCQAEGDSPFNTPESLACFAITAIMGGAVAIRSEGFEKTKKIAETVSVPVIGLSKSFFEDGSVRITGSFSEVENIILSGAAMVAVDGTFRERENMSGPDFIARIKAKYNIPVMADIATIEEALACADAGADCISTTLNGYTPETLNDNNGNPNLVLLSRLCDYFGGKIPVIAEGRFNKPEAAAMAMRMGAWSVVVGTAITRPQTITKWFYDAIHKAK
jgi:N-acylglucosamine-6-phosphate 2-epimerase